MSQEETKRVATAWTELHNRINDISKFSDDAKELFTLSEIKFKETLVSSENDVKVKLSRFEASVSYLKRNFVVSGKKNKKEARDALAAILVQYIDGLGGLDRVTCHSTSSLPDQPTQAVGVDRDVMRRMVVGRLLVRRQLVGRT